MKCIEWTGRLNNKGYGVYTSSRKVGKKTVLAHREAWAKANGPIPEGMEIRHKCDNPPCINPEHLEIGTHAQNMRDMVDRGRCNPWGRNVTHCPQGHEYTEENTSHYKNGRQCRTCVRDRAREHYRAKHPGIKLRKS